LSAFCLRWALKLYRAHASQGEKPNLQSAISLKAQRAFERRTTPRVSGPIPAVTLDAIASGQKLGAYAELENLSAGGFYLRLARPAEHGEKLSVIAQISHAIILLRGTVLRVEPQTDGAYGLAVEITQYRIFSLIDIGK